jgi:hypothetical protein
MRSAMDHPTNEDLRAEADRLLNGGLAKLLSRHGDVRVVGSYMLDLMTWRDLDIHVAADGLDLTKFFGLGGELAALLSPHRAHFRDERTRGTAGLPRGLYWGLYLGDERDGAWKIDIWMTDRAGLERSLEFAEGIASRLGPAERSAILRIKRACWRHSEYRRGFTSADVYAAVLERGVCDVPEFWQDLKEQRGIVGAT